MRSKEELFGGFSIGDWEVLPARGLLRQGDDEVHPEPKVFEVLIALAQKGLADYEIIKLLAKAFDISAAHCEWTSGVNGPAGIARV